MTNNKTKSSLLQNKAFQIIKQDIDDMIDSHEMPYPLSTIFLAAHKADLAAETLAQAFKAHSGQTRDQVCQTIVDAGTYFPDRSPDAVRKKLPAHRI